MRITERETVLRRTADDTDPYERIIVANADQLVIVTALANPERQILMEALEANNWNRQETAKMLGVNRTTLYKKMKRFKITFENSHES